MLYAKIVNDEVLEWPLYEKDIKEAHSNVSFPEKPTFEDFEALGYTAIPTSDPADVPAPDKDNEIVLGDLVKDEDGNWKRTYVLSYIQDEDDRLARLDRQWKKVKEKRDKLLTSTDWRVLRNLREVTLGLTPSEDISVLEEYRAQLANITDESDPFKIVWPEEV